MICFMAVVSVIVRPQRPVVLVRICMHGWGPFKFGVIPDEEEQQVVGDVKRGELGRIPFLFRLFLGALLILALAPFLFRLPLCGRFAALSGYHYCL